jgi:hypothetical protein
MNAITNAIKELVGRRGKIDAALRALHDLDTSKAVGTRAGVRNISAEGRKRIAEAQKQRWAIDRSRGPRLLPAGQAGAGSP